MYFNQTKLLRTPMIAGALLICACSAMDKHVTTPPTMPSTSPAATSSQEVTGSATSRSASAGEPVTVNLTEWKMEMPNSLPAGPTTFKITNSGKETHNLKIQGQGVEKELSKNLKPGESAELQVDLKPGTYRVYCPVGMGPASHASKGMAFQLVVTELK